jgi:hypothetical protein
MSGLPLLKAEPADAIPAALRSLLSTSTAAVEQPPPIRVGELVAIGDAGAAGYVRYAGQPGSAAAVARSVVELHEAHIGAPVVLAFDAGDALRPIILGVLRQPRPAASPELDGQVEVSVDGGRMTVVARDRLELRCGAASIILTRSGRVLIEGGYVLTRADGVNRVVGGSVQIN